MIVKEQWGPPLWKLFHSLAEQSGKQTESDLQQKELALWKLFIDALKNIVVCEACRLHVNHYLEKNPFSVVSYDSLNLGVRNYFYYFHEYLNQQTLKPTFDFSLLSSSYNNLGDLHLCLQEFTSIMDLAVQSNQVKKETYQEWLDLFYQLSILFKIPNVGSV